MKVKGSDHTVLTVKPENGFKFNVLWCNSPMIIEGALRYIEQMVGKPPDWQSQPSGIFDIETYVRGNIFETPMPLKHTKVATNVTNENYHYTKPKYKKYSYQGYMLNSVHETTTLHDSSLTQLKNLSGMAGINNLFNSTRSDLFFFFLREGEVYSKKLLINRIGASLEVYSEDNFEVAKKAHNEVIDRKWWTDQWKYSLDAFHRIANIIDYEELLSKWRRQVKIKDSMPAWSNELSSVVNKQHNISSIMTTMNEYMFAKETKVWNDFSWRWWYNFFENDEISHDLRTNLFGLFNNWHIRMGNTYAAMIPFLNKAINLDYNEYYDKHHLVFALPRVCGVTTGGRDSTGPVSCEHQGKTMRVVCKEDKQRNVGRGFTSCLSIIDHPDLKNHGGAGTDNKVVESGHDWLINQTCKSGVDAKNCDQTTGIEVNLPHYCRGLSFPIIFAVALLSGEEHTGRGNGKNQYDKAKYMSLDQYLRTISGDDWGLIEYDPDFIIEKFAEVFPWSFNGLTRKQTLDYKTDEGINRHLVFNLGITHAYANEYEHISQGRSFKLIKTEQSPIGAYVGDSFDFAFIEEAKAKFTDIVGNEQLLWYTEQPQQFNRYFQRLIDKDLIYTMADPPGSLLALL